jgi:hypothetical protein
MDMKLEVIVIPVSDVDRAKAFHEKLGWRMDIDFVRDEKHRVVQFTPPGSEASFHIGKGITKSCRFRAEEDRNKNNEDQSHRRQRPRRITLPRLVK